jgi:hypothetical protein
MTAGTVKCPKCGRDVPFTNEAWDASMQKCRECSGVPAYPVTVSQAPTPVKVVSLDIPMGDLFVLWLKLLAISVSVAIPIWAVLFLLRAV